MRLLKLVAILALPVVSLSSLAADKRQHNDATLIQNHLKWLRTMGVKCKRGFKYTDLP